MSEIPGGGGGILKAKTLEAQHEASLEFPGGGGREGFKTKTFRRGSIDIFWNCTLNIFWFPCEFLRGSVSGPVGGCIFMTSLPDPIQFASSINTFCLFGD